MGYLFPRARGPSIDQQFKLNASSDAPMRDEYAKVPTNEYDRRSV
jgi:hypothetical protein